MQDFEIQIAILGLINENHVWRGHKLFIVVHWVVMVIILLQLLACRIATRAMAMDMEAFWHWQQVLSHPLYWLGRFWAVSGIMIDKKSKKALYVCSWKPMSISRKWSMYHASSLSLLRICRSRGRGLILMGELVPFEWLVVSSISLDGDELTNMI